MKTKNIGLLLASLGVVAGAVWHLSEQQLAPSRHAHSPRVVSQSQTSSAPAPPSAGYAETVVRQFAIAAAPGNAPWTIADLIQGKLAAWRLATDPNEKFRLLEEMRALITDSNAPDVAQSLSEEDLAGQVGVAAMQHWLDSDPTAAAEWIATRGGTTEAQASLVSQHLLADPEGLQDYLANLPEDSPWRTQMLNVTGFGMAADDPQKAIAFAEQMESGSAKSTFLASAASEWASSNSAAAKDWAAKQEDPALREQLITAVAKSASATDPVAAASWIASSVTDPKLCQEATQAIIPRWMANDPDAAADWVKKFSPGPLRDASLEALLGYWNVLNPDVAHNWVSQLPDQDMRNKGLAILSQAATAVARE